MVLLLPCSQLPVLDDPLTSRLSISGISLCLMIDHRKDMHRVIVDPDKAVIFPGASLARQRKVAGFHMANVFEED
ncbi:hypothetical protein ASPFODRAFT_53097 [Aspergillus luchuensis CBS 106.47]|uniref:Uncharacterized protein n=1 Tax=Aspergillus luchuensis (strain CBS 106.47) TaxID=1137211 RepID=A0A1M3T1F2_ASPLC|nr:hypothetical protein ASPFODRAFT_53097 [Aspergillus luchuensis CBS 106.47]